MAASAPVQTTPGLDINTIASTSQGLNFLQVHLKSQLLDKVRTGDILYDGIIACVILSGSNSVIELIKWIKNKLLDSPDKLYRFVVRFYVWYKKRRDNTIVKTATISYITESREVNTLFTPLKWYISSLTDTTDSYNTVIESTSNNSTIIQSVPFNNSSFLKYKNHIIDYNITTKRIEIYGDRKYKRENTIITLTVKMNRTYNGDILKDFCDESKVEYDKFLENQRWEQRIYRNERKDGKCSWSSKVKKTTRKIDTVILKNDDMQDVIEDIDDFITKKQWYMNMGIPWTRRFMFHGKPGTGKSSAITAIACHTNRHIHYLILNEIETDTELFRLLEEIRFEQSILVIEDIDCASNIIRKREAQKELEKAFSKDEENECSKTDDTPKNKSKLTLAGFLNAIDGGIIDTHGQIMIVTTNHPEDLDEAVTRSGRVDVKVEFGNCNDAQIRGIYRSFFLIEPPNDYSFVPGYISPADVSSTFLRYNKNPENAWSKLIENYEHCTVKNALDIYEDVYGKPPVNISCEDMKNLYKSHKRVEAKEIYRMFKSSNDSNTTLKLVLKMFS